MAIDVFLHRLSSYGESSDWAYPSIYGNRIIWMGDHNGKSDIYVHDISTSEEARTTSEKAYHPAIYGDRIVWED